MKTHKSLTVMIPAYNEEKNLEGAVKNYNNSVKSVFNDYELIVFDDCSLDKTGEIADKLAKKYKKVKVIHNKKNMGLGYNYREGIKLAKKEYYIMLPGEGELDSESVKEILSHVGEADIIIPYIKNAEIRALIRRFTSKSFTTVLNILFGLNVRYYLGVVIHKTKFLKKVKMTTNSPAYQAEILVRMLKKGYSYKHIPYYVMKTQGSETFRLRNIAGIISTVLTLLNDTFIKRKF